MVDYQGTTTNTSLQVTNVKSRPDIVYKKKFIDGSKITAGIASTLRIDIDHTFEDEAIYGGVCELKNVVKKIKYINYSPV